MITEPILRFVAPAVLIVGISKSGFGCSVGVLGIPLITEAKLLYEGIVHL